MNSSHLENLNLNSSARDIEDYFERFEIWWFTQSRPVEEKKSAFFLNSVGREAYTLIKNLSFPTAPISVPYENIKSLLLRHVKPANFEATERAKFHSMVRDTNQGIRDFILQLLTQAAKCNFDDLDMQLKDRLIAGINDSTLQNELLRIPKPTFTEVRAHCEQFQDIRSATTDVPSANNSSSSSVMFHSTKRRQPRNANARPFKSGNNISSEHHNNHTFGKCASCGKFHSRLSCRFRQAVCHKCGKTGHIQSVCRSHKSCRFADSHDREVSDIDDQFSSLTLAVDFHSVKHIRSEIFTSSGNSLEFILDTGSIESLISKEDLQLFAPSAEIQPSRISIKGVTGHPVQVLGVCTLLIRNHTSSLTDCQFIVTDRSPAILGLRSMRALNISLSLLASNTSDFTLKDLIMKCSKVTGGMKIAPIKLDVQGEPIFMKRRIIPYGLREPVRKVLHELTEKGIIEKVASSAWGTPIVTPLKSDGKTPRICGDYRISVNKCLRQQTCVTVEPEDILNKLHGSKVFSKIDLKDAYLQIPLDESSMHVTTINTPFGLYKYRFLPFGLTNAPAIFQQVINTIVQGIDGVECYQDDVIVHAPTKVIHDERLLALFRRFHEKNVAVNSKKCAFSVSQFECLGYIVDVNGFRPDPNRLKPLSEACSPSDIRELRSLIGALQYYSRFIPNFSQRASLLFELLSAKKFEWCSSHEHCLREILNLLHSAVIRPFSPKLHSQLITDASPDGIGAVLEQNGRPVICVSRRLSQAEKGYAQTTREALAIYWSVKRLHKYLFGTHFTIVTDHQALKFIFDPNKSLSKSSAAMVQRWSIALSAYDYSIEHRSAKHIQHVDYISRQSLPATTKDDASSDSLLVQPLPVSRQDLIRDTRRYFGSVMVAVKKGWNAVVKRKFPFHYARRDELSVTPDGLLCANDRVVIPPTLRKAVLDDLHSGHLGVEKMKSLARMTCWWPHIDVDINRTAKNCTKCLHKMKNSPSNWIPWPMSTEVWQRVHADYCGPFLGKYYALIVIDSYSKWPEVFFTSSASAEFTIHALRKVFSREGVPSVLVTDNGTHFTADSVKQWLNGIGCRQLFTAARHPCSNGQAENFVKTLKSAIYSLEPTTFRELENGVDNFMLQYRNAVHCATKQSPARLFKGRSLRSNLLCLDSSDVTFFRGNDLRPSNGIILQNIGRRMCKILDTQDLTIHNRHVDQIRISEPGESVPISEVASESNSPTLDSVQTENDSTTLRRSARLNTKPRLDYNNPVVHSRCGECDE